MRRRELGAAAALLAFGLFALTQARGLRFGSVVAPGPGFFPLCLSAAFSLVCLFLLLGAWRESPDVAARASGVGLSGRLKVVGTLVSLLVYALVLEPAGFPLATFALLLFFFKVLQRQGWPLAVGGSLVTSLAIYVVFKIWIGVNLPAGPIRF